MYQGWRFTPWWASLLRVCLHVVRHTLETSMHYGAPRPAHGPHFKSSGSALQPYPAANSIAIKVHFTVEQPSSSKLVYIPYIQHLLEALGNGAHFKRFWMGLYGRACPKPSWWSIFENVTKYHSWTIPGRETQPHLQPSPQPSPTIPSSYPGDPPKRLALEFFSKDGNLGSGQLAEAQGGPSFGKKKRRFLVALYRENTWGKKPGGFFFFEIFPGLKGNFLWLLLGCAESMLSGSEGKNIRNLKA